MTLDHETLHELLSTARAVIAAHDCCDIGETVARLDEALTLLESCTGCHGAGWVQKRWKLGTSGSHAFTYVPCTDCGKEWTDDAP